ncbi:AraC family transcriptional regulator [Chitinophagaceae bacterium LB-8]|uniref:AraC family transcriptional regulator n=1 Tax=Paraflavisolibacter caeni TaxID=2982496 RepID=A0A9X2XUH2_9BACT|nr:AraC family transcriptional regulator [Paraflavisolibacter caeni]MCU7547968.1 AraC family transcriptional regulator [Paraflavisolibacter caeni]
MSRRWLNHSFSLLHVDHVRLNHKWNYTNVISPYYRIYYIDEGEGFILSSKETIKLEAGYLYIIPSFTLCNLKCSATLSQYFLHLFEESPDGISLFSNNRTLMQVQANDIDIANFKRILQINPGRGINRSDNPKVYEKNVYYKEYQELNNMQRDAVYLETQGIILQLLSRFLDSEKFKQKNAASIPSKILEAISYIQLNLDKDLTVVNLAKRANQNLDYFSRLFLQYTGERPHAYVQEKRIERAQYIITTTNKSYSEIAEETGFESLPHFSRIFKKVTSLTPGQYRQQNHSFSMFQ